MSVDYIITENGMRIRKGVAIKPDASSQDKEINEDDLELLCIFANAPVETRKSFLASIFAQGMPQAAGAATG